MKYFAGLDVSLQDTAICVVDEDGIVIREGKAASEPDDLVRWLTASGLTITRVGLEAGPLSPWLHTELREAGLPAICIETRRMKGATAAMAVKTDRNDARAIAHAMRVGWFTAVHVKTAESQELRLLLSNRRTLLEKRVAIDNEIRGTLKAFGLKLGAVGVAGFEATGARVARRTIATAGHGPPDAHRPRCLAAAMRGAASDGAQGRASERGVPAPALGAGCRSHRRADLRHRRR